MSQKYIATRIGLRKEDKSPYTILCPIVSGVSKEKGAYGFIDTNKAMFVDGHIPVGTVKAYEITEVKA